MKKLVSISVLIITFMLGAMSPIDKPTIYERFYPDFSQNEFNSLLGKKVIFKYQYIIGLQKYRVVSYPIDAEKNPIHFLRIGDTGKFVSVEKVLENKNPAWRKIMKNCPLLIKWDEKNAAGKEMFTCADRFTNRVFWEVEK